MEHVKYLFIALITLSLSTSAVLAGSLPKEQCNGQCSGPNGGYWTWRITDGVGECKIVGSCQSTVSTQNTTPPSVASANTKAVCEKSGLGTWCTVTIKSGASVSYCTQNYPVAKSCATTGFEKGYILKTGAFKVGCSLVRKIVQNPTDGDNFNRVEALVWESNLPSNNQYKNEADNLCFSNNGTYNFSSKNYFGLGIFSCKEGVNGYTNGQSCVAGNSITGKSLTAIPACFCGVVQQDTGSGHNTYMSSCGCGTTPAPVAPTITPPPTLTPVAACQRVIMLDRKRLEPLTPQILSTYSTRASFEMCVLGSTNTGNFIKAAFTVNGVERVPTGRTLVLSSPTVPVSGTYFCETYTIPADTYDFFITAKVYHSTLGWK